VLIIGVNNFIMKNPWHDSHSVQCDGIICSINFLLPPGIISTSIYIRI